MIPKRFLPYLGNNNELFPALYQHSGAFYFSKWEGHPLCDKLWDDLATKLHIQHLYIYRTDEGFVYRGLPPNSAVILLYIDYTIWEIIYESWYS
jgi:hypothetical protein